MRQGALGRGYAAMKDRRESIGRFRQSLLQAARAAPTDPSLAIAGLSIADAVDVAISRIIRDAHHSDYAANERLRTAYAGATLQTRRIPLAQLDRWRVDRDTGNIEHESGRFFTILGASIRHRHNFDEQNWNQPFIDQSEIGILGILATEFDGILHFCLQAKEEPGNINSVQLSPTVQATYSNYTRSHGGKRPPLVELFLDPKPENILFSRLQTEDGGRFLYKSNRNMIVRCRPDDLPELSDQFLWLTLRQIAGLLRRDNVVNACARSILSALLQADPIDRKLVEAAAGKAGLRRRCDTTVWPAGDGARNRTRMMESSTRALLGWRDNQKAITHLHVLRTPLASLRDWRIDKAGYFSHKRGHFFRVIGLAVQSGSREIASWTQPILENPREGIIGLLVRQRAGVREVLLQAKAEPGNRPAVQLAPTVQFTPANYLDNVSLQKPFLFDEFMEPTFGRIVSESRQSEEGARFYRESHLHRIIEVPEDFELDLPENYRWCSIDDARFFIHLGEHVNSCARSILACLL